MHADGQVDIGRACNYSTHSSYKQHSTRLVSHPQALTEESKAVKADNRPSVSCGEKADNRPSVSCGDKADNRPSVSFGNKADDRPSVSCGDKADNTHRLLAVGIQSIWKTKVSPVCEI